MCKYQSLSFYVPLGAVFQISGGISYQRRRRSITPVHFVQVTANNKFTQLWTNLFWTKWIKKESLVASECVNIDFYMPAQLLTFGF